MAKTKNKTEVLHFYTTGEGMNNIGRDLWESYDIKKAIDIYTLGLGATVAQAIGICTGGMELRGSTQEPPHELQLFTINLDICKPVVERMISKIEDLALRDISNCTALKRDILLMCGEPDDDTDEPWFSDKARKVPGLANATGGTYRRGPNDYFSDREVDVEKIKNGNKKIKKHFEGLEILYEFLGMKMSDFPWHKIFSDNSIIELAEMGYASDARTPKSPRQVLSILKGDGLSNVSKEALDNLDKFLAPPRANFYEPDILNKNHMHGWVSPDGKFYEVGQIGHLDWAHRMIDGGYIKSKFPNDYHIRITND
jgi:hypothetical protein